MTLHIADIAVYQAGLSVARLREAGFGALNVKVSHGVTQRTVHPNVQTYVQQARAEGMGLSSFHWLDASAPGAVQARYAFQCMQALGLTTAAAHVVDCESNALLGVYQDYCATMQDLLGRAIVTYTGDWWWVPRGWKPATPWLHSAPAAGYLPAYPGDTSPHWAGYGGWPELAVMQYRVAQVDGIAVSQSAVRSMDTWRAMTGEAMGWENTPASESLVAEFNEAFPTRDKASDGTIGDPAHAGASSDHNPDETGKTPFEDADTKNEVHARDIDSTLRRPGWTMFRCFEIIRKRALAGQENRVQNLICDRKITSRSWGFIEWRPYTGSNPHTQHGHVGLRYGSGPGLSNPENDTGPWGILAAIQKEDAVTPEEIKAVAKATADELLNRKLEDPYDKSEDPRELPVSTWLRYSPSRGQVENIANTVRASGAEIMSLLVALASREEVDPNALAGALASPLASALAPLLPEDKEVTAATLRDAFQDLFAGQE